MLPATLIDRIDIHLDVPRVDYEILSDSRTGETSAAIRARVSGARDRQRALFRRKKLHANAEMGPGEVHDFCRIDRAAYITEAV